MSRPGAPAFLDLRERSSRESGPTGQLYETTICRACAGARAATLEPVPGAIEPELPERADPYAFEPVWCEDCENLVAIVPVADA